jgi:hypothetical protein
METPVVTEDIIVYKDTPQPNANTVPSWQLAYLISANMFKAIHNNDFANFQESSKTKYDNNINKNDERDKLYNLGAALNTSIKKNYLVKPTETLAKLDIPDKDGRLTPQEYILNRLEKIHSTYNSTEQEKTNIKALWDILTYSTDDPKFKESNFIKFSKYFQSFLRKIMGDYKSIDEVIGKTEKDKFIEKYLDKTIAERYNSAKSFFSFGKKPEVTTAATAVPATVPAATAVPATVPAAAPVKKGWFSGGKRKSRKQSKSRKQGKSRKQRKSRK